MAFIHVVSKQDNASHSIIKVPSPPATALSDSTVRVRTISVTLSANNLSYARGGSRLHWWDAYPVPSFVSEPYNNRDDWGVVPAWGQAEILESNIVGLSKGDLLFGLQPTSSEPQLLELEAVAPAGTWMERSKQRASLMDFYNTYRLDSSEPPHGIDREAFLGGRIVAEGPWLLYNYVFAAELEKRLHPLGIDDVWADTDADLSNSVLISLSAGGKTARAFAWCSQQPRDKNVPLALLQVTTNASNLRSFTDGPFPVSNVDYRSLLEDSVFNWVKGFKPSRVVICDFGAKNDVLMALYHKVSAMELDPLIIGIGSEAKVYTADEQDQTMRTSGPVGKRQLNTGGLRPAAIRLERHPAVYFENMDKVTNDLLVDQGLGELTVDRRVGVSGINSAWDDLCAATVSPTSYINVYL